MRFAADLIPATLLRRYKRFLADVRLPDGAEATAHCPNPGAMTGLALPGSRIWLEPNRDPRKKLDFGWRLTELADGSFACIDTSLANRVVAESLREGGIDALSGYPTVRAEVRFGQNSRADFALSDGSGPDAVVEVKSITLMRKPGLAEFPDTVTARGTKHLRELAGVASQGGRAVMLYLVQHGQCDRATLAADIDQAYHAAAGQARLAGVEFLALRSDISTQSIRVGGPVPFHLPD